MTHDPLTICAADEHVWHQIIDVDVDCYACFECTEIAWSCEECGGVVYPAGGNHVCDECLAERGDFE